MSETNEAFKVSVIVPVRDGEATIVECLDSLASQTKRPDEIIVVENGSRDETVFLVKQWIVAHSDLHTLLVMESQKGPSAARNRGMKVAKGDLLAFLDADCVAPSDWLQRISQEMRQGVGAVGGPYRNHPSVSPLEKYAAMSWFFGNGHEVLSLSNPFVSRFLLGGNMALLRRYLEEAGGFDERLRAGEDLELSFRLKKGGVRMKSISHLAVTHKIRSSFVKGMGRAFRHGILQSRIAGSHFRKSFTLSFFEKSWVFPFPFTVAIEAVSLTKIVFLLFLLGYWRPLWGIGLLGVLTLLWETKMVIHLTRLEERVSFRDGVAISLGWASSRMAMETGRWVGSLRYGVFCF